MHVLYPRVAGYFNDTVIRSFLIEILHTPNPLGGRDHMPAAPAPEGGRSSGFVPHPWLRRLLRGGRYIEVPIARSSVPAGRPSPSQPRSHDLIDGLLQMVDGDGGISPRASGQSVREGVVGLAIRPPCPCCPTGP